jgi:hypothetical protein
LSNVRRDEMFTRHEMFLDYAEEMAVDVCIWVYQIKDEEQKCSKRDIYILMAGKDENKPI